MIVIVPVPWNSGALLQERLERLDVVGVLHSCATRDGLPSHYCLLLSALLIDGPDSTRKVITLVEANFDFGVDLGRYSLITPRNWDTDKVDAV